ncbi:MAG TPA: NAD-binding protein [Rubrobacteraceae bacterium]|nr:NAD-binding protein [Rubrobacteraceae bacterium]
MEALYMTAITLTIVGYKKVRELDTSGQLWTMALLTTGFGTLLYAAVSAVEIVVEGAVGGYFERKRVRNKIDKLNEHYILGGFDRVGRQVAQESAADGVPFVIIHQDPQKKVEECIEKGCPALFGEASEDDTLEEASDAHAASSPPSTPTPITSSSCSRRVRSTPTFTSLPGPPLMSQPPNCR